MEAYLGDIWFFLWGLLWAIYFALDGFDFGIGMLVPAIGLGSEKERSTMHLATGPVWDGNQVWLITAGGVTFAAFPLAYAVMFSSLYTALLLLLLMLILRGAAAELRHQSSCGAWRQLWDLIVAGASFLAALLLGVAFSNIFRGLPLDAGHIFQGYEILGGLTSNTLSLLHPYCLLGGVLFVVMFALHGAMYLSWRVSGDLSAKSLIVARVLWPVFMVIFLLYVVLTFAWAGLWVNYALSPLLLGLPLACVLAFLAGGHQLYRTTNTKTAFIYNGLGIITLTLTGIAGIYPNLLPSRLDPAGALTIANASSTPKTLGIMLAVALVFVPIVILYQWWAHRQLAHRLNAEYE